MGRISLAQAASGPAERQCGPDARPKSPFDERRRTDAAHLGADAAPERSADAMNVLEQITPETLAALSSEEKRELLALLEAQQMPRLARHIERMHAWRAQGGKLDPNFSYSQALEE